jgi:DNA-damage-inducible protein J
MATAKTTNFTVRLDARVKEDAEKLFADFGMTLSSAFNIFLHQSLMTQGLPFAVRRERPNKKTLAAMREAIELANDPNAKTFSSIDELMKDLME